MTLGSTDVSILNVRNILGYPSTDLGTLCSLGEDYINKWSKYKPVRYNFTTSRPSTWWKAQDGSCGLYYQEYDTTWDMLQDIVAGNTFWKYQPPRGGSSEPFRLGDFAGYSNDARNPIQCMDIPSPFYRDTYPTLSVAMDNVSVNESYNLQLTDFSGKNDLKTFYPAIYIAKVPSGSETLKDGWFMTANVTIANNDGEGIEVPTTNLLANNSYYVIYCLSSIKQTTFSQQTTDATFVPVPASNALQTILVKTGGLLITLNSLWQNSKVTYTITAKNQIPDTTASITNVKLQIVYADYGIDRFYEISGEYTLDLADVTGIAYNSTRTITGTVLNALPDINSKGGKLILRYTYNGVVNTLTEEMGMSN